MHEFLKVNIDTLQIREFTGEDDSDLFHEEREIALKKAQDDKKRYQMTVPGMLNPHEVLEEMQEEMWLSPFVKPHFDTISKILRGQDTTQKAWPFCTSSRLLRIF